MNIISSMCLNQAIDHKNYASELIDELTLT